MKWKKNPNKFYSKSRTKTFLNFDLVSTQENGRKMRTNKGLNELARNDTEITSLCHYTAYFRAANIEIRVSTSGSERSNHVQLGKCGTPRQTMSRNGMETNCKRQSRQTTFLKHSLKSLSFKWLSRQLRESHLKAKTFESLSEGGGR